MARQVEPGSAKPAWVREPFEFVDLIGRRSADSIRAARRLLAGRIHGCTRRCIADKPLGKRGTSIVRHECDRDGCGSNALLKMRVDPSKSACRSRLQITS